MTGNQDLNKYFNKIIYEIDNRYAFRFLGISFVKKKNIEDLLCCLLAIIPTRYKNMIDIGIEIEQEGMCSIKAYKQFLEHFNKSFLSYYIISPKKIKNDISTLIPLLNKDIEFLNQ